MQTVFEGYAYNTPDKLRYNQVKHALKIPMAHTAGKSEPGGIPEIMRTYRSGGTPWTVIISPDGRVIYNHFHIKVPEAVALIESAVSMK